MSFVGCFITSYKFTISTPTRFAALANLAPVSHKQMVERGLELCLMLLEQVKEWNFHCVVTLFSIKTLLLPPMLPVNCFNAILKFYTVESGKGESKSPDG